MWTKLKSLAQDAETRKITELFEDPGRAEAFSTSFDQTLFDFSKTNIDAATLAALLELAENAGVATKRDAMFSGAKINETEGRAVLHTALRNLDGAPVAVDGEDVMPGVLKTLDRMSDFAGQVRDGSFRGQGGAITDVVNIGIGGSDLGPVMAYKALAPYADGPRVHYVSLSLIHISEPTRPY